MGFVNPLLLWFAMGGAIPVIIHLLHRQKFRRVRWAAMEFLLAALKKTQRRLRVENLILLLLRILILVILALAIAQPFVSKAMMFAPAESRTHYIIVIDNSYSMGYKKAQISSLDTAKKAAEQVLGQLKPSDEDLFTFLLMSDFPERPMKVRNKLQMEPLKSAINDTQISHYGTDMYRTLREIQEALNDPLAKNTADRRIYIFTDLQKNAWIQRETNQANKFKELLSTLSHDEHTGFFIIDCGTPGAINRAIVDLRVTDPVVTTKKTTKFAVDVYNFSSTSYDDVRVTLYVDDNYHQARSTPLQSGALVTVNFTYDFLEAGPHVVKAALTPVDFLDVDDQRWLALDVKTAVKGLLIDGEPGRPRLRTATGTLSLVLDPYGDARSVFSAEVQSFDNLNLENLDQYDFIVLANVRELDPTKVEKLEQFVAKGGGLLISMGTEVHIRPFNELFYKGGEGLSPAALVDVLGQHPDQFPPRGAPRRIQSYTETSPIFRTFVKELRAAVFDLVFYNYMKVDGYKYCDKCRKLLKPDEIEDDKCKLERKDENGKTVVCGEPVEHRGVVAYLDDGNKGPLILEKRYKEGKVVLFTSTINHEWNDGLPGKPAYFAVCLDLCEYLAARPLSRRNFVIGDTIQITFPATMAKENFVLDIPREGKESTLVTLPPTSLDSESKVFNLFYPSLKGPDDSSGLVNRGLTRAGKYTLTRREARTEDKPFAYFACNLPPKVVTTEELQLSEGNLDRISPDEIQSLYPDFKVTFLGEKSDKSQEVGFKPPSSGIWRYLLIVLIAFLGLETVLGWLFGRAKQ